MPRKDRGRKKATFCASDEPGMVPSAFLSPFLYPVMERLFYPHFPGEDT